MYKLFCPGPVNINKIIKNEIIPDITHRGILFQNLFKECSNLTKALLNINNNKYTPLFLTGSGTLAVESMIYSYVSGKNTLLLQNGSFADKWKTILNKYSNNYDTIDFGWCNSFDYDKIKNK